jgi:quercetin dioxygenase-like cupin family protein
MEIRVVEPFHDGRPRWLGLAEEGLRRKVFTVVDHDLAGAREMAAGLAVFEPGEASSEHSHPDAEEIIYVVRGSGVIRSGGEERSFGPNTVMFNPRGISHQHVNTGSEPLWLFFVYSPPADLPPR